MRLRVFTALFAVVAVFCLVGLRHHIRVLRDILHTYSTFYPLLRSSSDELIYRFPQPVDASPEAPKIIHQIALGNSSLAKYSDAMESCRQFHPGWEFKLWMEANATEFMESYYPDIAPHYTGYFQNIQRANVLRYAVLHKYGGVYLDLDITCLVDFESTSLMSLSFVSPGAHPAGVNNALIVAKPNHGFLSHLLAAVPRHDLAWRLPMRLPYIENMLSTGCMFFSNQWIKYAEAYIDGEASDPVRVLANEDGDIAPHMLRGVVTTPIVRHGGASSWHGWDAAAIVAVGKFYKTILLCVSVFVTAVSMITLLRCMRTRHRRQRGWMAQQAEKGVLDEM